MLRFLHSFSFIFQHFSNSRIRLKTVEGDVKVLGIWTGMKINNIVNIVIFLILVDLGATGASPLSAICSCSALTTLCTGYGLCHSAVCTLNTSPPTHKPPSPSLHYLCSSETTWHRHKSSTNVGNVDSAALENQLSIPPRPGLHRSKEAIMLSSRASENTCPVAKAQPWG